MENDFQKDTIIIGKEEYETKEGYLNHFDLKFYPQNPRVYSILNTDDFEPTQEQIQNSMCSMDHVKQLKTSISTIGGVLEPLIVRDGDFVVLDGNSRLAAYRLLSQIDPVKWMKVRCKILPKHISDSAIFAILGTLHIISRKDWNPFEQAGYLYRFQESSNLSTEEIAIELGLKVAEAKTYLKVYSFMLEHDDVEPQRWSYYVEYLKNKSINKYRQKFPDLDESIVGNIKAGKITNAIDIRDKLGAVTSAKGKDSEKIVKSIVDKKIDIYEAYDEICDTGKTENSYKTLRKFREKIGDYDFQTSLKQNLTEETSFELKKIHRSINKLVKELNLAK